MRHLPVAALIALLAAGCFYPADSHGECINPTDDRVFIDIGDRIDAGFVCFNDGDGYPTIYAPVTTAPEQYPTVGQ